MLVYHQGPAERTSSRLSIDRHCAERAKPEAAAILLPHLAIDYSEEHSGRLLLNLRLQLSILISALQASYHILLRATSYVIGGDDWAKTSPPTSVESHARSAENAGL